MMIMMTMKIILVAMIQCFARQQWWWWWRWWWWWWWWWWQRGWWWRWGWCAGWARFVQTLRARRSREPDCGWSFQATPHHDPLHVDDDKGDDDDGQRWWCTNYCCGQNTNSLKVKTDGMRDESCARGKNPAKSKTLTKGLAPFMTSVKLWKSCQQMIVSGIRKW